MGFWHELFRKKKEQSSQTPSAPATGYNAPFEQGRVAPGGWALACWSGVPAICGKHRLLFTVSHLRPIPKKGLSPYRSFDTATHEWYVWLCNPDNPKDRQFALHYQADLGDWLLVTACRRLNEGDWSALSQAEKRLDACAIACSIKAAALLNQLPCYTLEQQKLLLERFEKAIADEYRKCPHFRAKQPFQILLKDGRASLDGREP